MQKGMEACWDFFLQRGTPLRERERVGPDISSDELAFLLSEDINTFY